MTVGAGAQQTGGGAGGRDHGDDKEGAHGLHRGDGGGGEKGEDDALQKVGARPMMVSVFRPVRFARSSMAAVRPPDRKAPSAKGGPRI